MDDSTTVWLRVQDDGADDHDTENLATMLRAVLLDLDDASVERPRAGDAPPGAKAVEWAAVGALLVTVAGSPVLASLIDAVSAWLGDRRARRVRIEVDGDPVELAGAPTPQERERTREWVRRHSTRRGAGARHALIVANSDYTDPNLSRLRAPARDAERLAAVLGDPGIGGFSVRTLLDQPAAVINEAVEDFFADRSPDDLLLLHFSGHGVKDDSGELHFAASGTRLNRLGGTAVAANFVTRLMNRSRSRRIVLLLDCCYSGAFASGMVARAGTTLALDEQFGGTGRAVLTASSAMEYAFEGQDLADSRDAGPSVFTSALVAGLDTGEADTDQDGFVGLDELYEYVYAQVRRTTPNQTPGKWVMDLRGDLRIAKRARPVSSPSPLPDELAHAAAHPLPSVRAGAVDELARLAEGPHAGLALAGAVALRRLADDDSRAVAARAAAALGVRPSPQPEPPPPPDEPPRDSAPEPVPEEPIEPEPALVAVDRLRENVWTVASRIAAVLGVLSLLGGGGSVPGMGYAIAAGSSAAQESHGLGVLDVVGLWVLAIAALVLVAAPAGGRERAAARAAALAAGAGMLGALVMANDGAALSDYTSWSVFGSWMTACGVLLIVAAAALDALSGRRSTVLGAVCAAAAVGALIVHLAFPRAIESMGEDFTGALVWLVAAGLAGAAAVLAVRRVRVGAPLTAEVCAALATALLCVDGVILITDLDRLPGTAVLWPAVLIVLVADVLDGGRTVVRAAVQAGVLVGLLVHAAAYLDPFSSGSAALPHLLVLTTALLAAVAAPYAAAMLSASTRDGSPAQASAV